MGKKPDISLFLPCFNDENTIKKLVDDAFLTLKKVASQYEVTVVDDGSTDKSRIVLTKLSKKYRKLKLIFHEKNLGYGGTLKSGFKQARFEWIFYTDGDGQYDVKELATMALLIDKNTDFINGIKILRQDPTYRIFLGNLYNILVRWLFWVPIFDVDCDFRLINKKIIDKINLENNSGAICIELVKKAHLIKAQFKQVSVHHYARSYGNSEIFRTSRIVASLFELAKTWFKLMIFRN